MILEVALEALFRFSLWIMVLVSWWKLPHHIKKLYTMHRTVYGCQNALLYIPCLNLVEICSSRWIRVFFHYKYTGFGILFHLTFRRFFGFTMIMMLRFVKQVPGTTQYSLALYYMLTSPLEETPLLERFVNGDDAFRNSRFKLIPYISKVFCRGWKNS